MLMKESDSFARNDDDIGCIDELQMRINLSDDTPVQKTYRPIAKPLYPEVKQYVEDSSIADGYENQNLRIPRRSCVSVKRMGLCAYVLTTAN